MSRKTPRAGRRLHKVPVHAPQKLNTDLKDATNTGILLSVPILVLNNRIDVVYGRYKKTE